MGMANSNTHKQDNFFTHFFRYFCLGIYAIFAEFIGLFTGGWNKTSRTLNNAVGVPGADKNLGGAYLKGTEADAKARAEANTKVMMQKQAPKKIVKVSDKLIQSREALINAIEATEEVRSDNPVTYRYEALSPYGTVIKGTFYGFSKTEVYTFLENEGYKVCAPLMKYCTDNAAMVASCAYFNTNTFDDIDVEVFSRVK